MKGATLNTPLVSVVTVNFNETEATCELLDSLKKITYPNIEVIVVDNNSDLNHTRQIKNRFPNATIVQSPINYGFAAGSNFGIMRAKGKYILLLNNDTIVTPEFLEPLVETLENNEKIGVVSPLIKFYYSPKTIQYAGATPINPYTVRNRTIGFNEKDAGQYADPRQTAFGHGAAMMVPMKVIEKTGMMSYAYFLYYEEADWCYRIKKSGYEIWLNPASVVYHKESLSTGKASPLKVFYLNRGRLIYLLRNSKGITLFIAFVYQFLIAVPKNSVSFLLRGKFDLLKAYLKAIGWVVINHRKKEIYETPTL